MTIIPSNNDPNESQTPYGGRMMLDFSYMNELPSEAQEQAIMQAIEKECFRAISTYLTEVADKMESSNIESLNVPTLRAMAQELTNRNTNNEEN